MERISFTTEEKAEMFDEIAANFYNANFGQMSKSSLELLMFSFYMDKLIRDNKFEDGTIDYHKCSDYRISKELGITQQRVQSLKIKKQLVYPTEYKWETALAKLTENARYDPETKKVTLNIPDPNLYLEIQNFIEEKGAYVEKQLNRKILQLRAEYYIELVISLEPEHSKRKIVKELKKSFSHSEKINTGFDENHIGKSLVDMAVNVTETAANLSKFISPGNQLANALLTLLTRN